ncbi:hypothetical protein GCM10009864_39250 [Streptomyces lunalinharesii]|uniref:Uncharacterized protein n=1 Tax=Streptomyces lunalinharesii TaxID=333384 RepID=A0ABN3S1Z6_9ACTN
MANATTIGGPRAAAPARRATAGPDAVLRRAPISIGPMPHNPTARGRLDRRPR